MDSTIKRLAPFLYKILTVFFVLIITAILGLQGCSRFSGSNTTFTVARNASWPPLNLLGKDTNMLAFTHDLLSIIANHEKLNIKLVTLTHAHLFERLDKRVYDAILLYVIPDPIITARYAFSEPIYLSGPVLVVAEHSDIEDLHDLHGQIIGMHGNIPISFKLDPLSNAIVIPYDNVVKALDDVEHGSLAGLIMEAPLAYGYLSGFYKDKFKIATQPLTDAGIRLVAHKNEAGAYLIEHFNEGLRQLQEDETYHKLLRHWDLTY